MGTNTRTGGVPGRTTKPSSKLPPTPMSPVKVVRRGNFTANLTLSKLRRYQNEKKSVGLCNWYEQFVNLNEVTRVASSTTSSGTVIDEGAPDGNTIRATLRSSL